MSLPSPTDACARARERVSLRIDGELPLIEAVALRSHLRRCSDCRAAAADLGRITSELRSAPLEVPDFQIALPRRRYRSFAALAPVGVAMGAIAAALSLTQIGPKPLSIGPPPATRASDASTLHAAYTEQRLARLFLNGSLATRVQHIASLMN